MTNPRWPHEATPPAKIPTTDGSIPVGIDTLEPSSSELLTFKNQHGSCQDVRLIAEDQE